MPRGLKATEKTVWRLWAPHALQSLTLTAATAGAFADFCKAVSLRDELRRRIDREGWTLTDVTVDRSGTKHAIVRKHPLFTEFRAWQQRVEAAQARFRLTAFGKEIPPAEKPEDPFEEFDAQPTRVQ